MTVPQPREIPEFPTLTAELFDGGSGRLDLPDGERELAGEHLRACAQQALDLAARYADQTLRRPVRLRASDPGGISLFGVYPDGTCVELEARQPRSPSPAEPTPPPADANGNGTAPGRWARPELRSIVGGQEPKQPTEPSSVSPTVDLDQLLAPEHIYTGQTRSLLGRLLARVGTKAQNREELADRALANAYLRGLRDGVTTTIASVKGGAGKSALCRGLADVLTEQRFGPVVVLEADLDLGTIGESAPAIARGATLLDVWNDREKLTNSGKLQAYLTRFPSGAALLRAPTKIADIHQVTTEVLDGVLALLEEHYPIVLIDASPGLGVHNPVVAWSYQVATHIVTVAPARRATVKQLELLLGHLAHEQATKPVTAVLNQVPDRSPAVDAILRAARSLADERDLHEVPYDATLDFLVDAANLEIARLAQPTRVALKELAVTLANSWSQETSRR